MREFENLWEEGGGGICGKRGCEKYWRAALGWYQSVAEKCEKDCETPEDFKVLYFHLKQVLKNEVR